MIKTLLANLVAGEIKDRFTKDNMKSKSTKYVAAPTAAAGAGLMAVNGPPQSMEEALIYVVIGVVSFISFYLKEGS